MDYNLIHICNDEKFINSAIEQFESAFPHNNSFYIVSSFYQDTFKYVKNNKITKSISEPDLLNLELNENDIIILHSLCPTFYDFVCKQNRKIKIICIFFGYEIYNDVYLNNFLDIYDNETIRKCNLNPPSWIYKIKEFIKLKTIFKDHKYSLKRKLNALERVNYFGIPYIEEYNKVSELTKIQKKQFIFWYYPIENIIDINAPIHLAKSKMLIGHSGTMTCNHLDVFLKLQDINFKMESLVLPLNYGDIEYIELVKKVASQYFQQNVIFLESFMPLDEYNLILSSIKVAILNNKRQQAIGNTIALLWFGAKVFLSEKNTFFHFLKRNKIIVFSYENELNLDLLKNGLSMEEIKYNRQLLLENLNSEYLKNILINEILNINER